jgi:hypothetical protein
MRAAVLAALTILAALPADAALPEAAARCVDAARDVAKAQDLPADLLVGIALAESGRRVRSATVPWPWTVNAGGRGWWFETKAAAIAHVRQLQSGGTRSIDVGCFQVNLRWHGDAFAGLEEAFDPGANAAYAASFLAELMRTVGPTRAVGHYHSATPALSERYRQRVSMRRAQAAELLSATVAAALRHGPTAAEPLARNLFLFAHTAGLSPWGNLFGRGEHRALHGDSPHRDAKE